MEDSHGLVCAVAPVEAAGDLQQGEAQGLLGHGALLLPQLAVHQSLEMADDVRLSRHKGTHAGK